MGWSYSSNYIAEVLNRARGPFNVSGPAQSAGIAALRDEEFFLKSQFHNRKWLTVLTNEFNKMGLKIYPSVANFILINFDDVGLCTKVNEFLLDNGVIVREMSAYNLPSCLRVTVGLESENYKIMELFSGFRP